MSTTPGFGQGPLSTQKAHLEPGLQSPTVGQAADLKKVSFGSAPAGAGKVETADRGSLYGFDSKECHPERLVDTNLHLSDVHSHMHSLLGGIRQHLFGPFKGNFSWYPPSVGFYRDRTSQSP